MKEVKSPKKPLLYYYRSNHTIQSDSHPNIDEKNRLQM